MELSQLLDGSDHRALACAFVNMIRNEKRCSIDRFNTNAQQCNEIERAAFTVWESCGLLSSGGFLYLIENDADLANCADCYDRIGMKDVAGVFLSVAQLIPVQFHNQRYDVIFEELADWTEEESVYNQFRSFDQRYCELTARDAVADAIAQYLRENRDRVI